MNLNKILSEAELTELEDFLNSNKTPKRCMSLDMLDGLITCVAIGPETIMPSVWMEEIWCEEEGDEMIWDSQDEMMKITELILRHYQSTVNIFSKSKKDFAPIIANDKNSKPDIEGWATGFWIGIGLSESEWNILFEDDDNVELTNTLYLFGSQDGYELYKSNSELQEIDKEEWALFLTESIIEIYDYWLPHRKMPSPDEHIPMPKIGRNDPCPCGSGKKFKKCCLKTIPNA